MKKFIVALFLGFAFTEAYSQVFVEDFNDEADDATSGTSTGGTWSSTCTGCPANSFSKQTILGDEYFLAGANLDNEGVWMSNSVDISSYTDVAVYIETATLLTEAGDYMDVYYNLDNSGEVLFHSQATGSGTSYGLSPTLNGSTLQIVVRAFNNAGGDYFSFDNVAITNTIYSRATPADWGTSGTWSATGINGATCGCTPTAYTSVVVGGGHTISITAAATAANLTVNGTADTDGAGILDWSGNFDLNIDQGGSITVNSGGEIDGNGNADSRITFTDDVGHSIVNNGTISIGDITLTGPAFPDLGTLSLDISGSGTLSVTDDIITSTSLLAPNIDNNHTGSFTIGGDITFNTSSTFTNNQTLTISGSISFNTDDANVVNNGTFTCVSFTSVDTNDDDNIVTNSGGATLNFGSINPNNGDFDLLNSGTINQTGNFTNLSTGDTNIDNLNGGVWNWSYVPGTATDTDLGTVLNCSTNSNTFNYSGAGNQLIFGSQYHHITLSGSGTKTSQANLDANGDVTISGSAQLDVDTGNDTFTIAGNWTNTSSNGDPFLQGTETVTLNGSGSTVQTISNTSGETFYNLTINNTSSSHIVFSNDITISNTLDMTSGIVNLSGTTLTLGSSGVASDLNRTASTTTNWMYGGSFTRYWLASTAVSSTAGNLYGLFPIGTSAASSYRPFQITSTANPTATGSVTVTHTDASTATDLSPVYSDAGTDIVRKHDAQFVVATSGVTGGTYNISATMTGLLTGTLSDIRLAVSNGSTTVTTVGTHTAATGTAPNPTAGRTGASLANLSGDFRISTTNSTNTPLPIELLDFSAKQVDNGVLLNWSTATELNNDFFTIERMYGFDDEEKFAAIETIKGQGTTNELHDYQTFDHSPFEGKNYYRLKQTDFDGKFSYSDVKMVEFKNTQTVLKVFPNPVKEEAFTVELNNLMPGQYVLLELMNSIGVSVHHSGWTADQNGTMKATIQTISFPKGMYIVVAGAETALKRKLIIE